MSGSASLPEQVDAADLSLDNAVVKSMAHQLFQRICGIWSLSASQQRLILLGPGAWEAEDGVVFVFDNKLRERERDILGRMATVFEIFLLCRELFHEDDQAAINWLKEASTNASLSRVAPITWMVHGGRAGMEHLKVHLQIRRLAAALK